jgi:hypothetical protein
MCLSAELLELARWFPRLVPSSLLEGGKGELPRELVALALARPMERQHIGTEQNADPQVAEPLDPLPERGMLSLGGIQIGALRHQTW